MPGLLLGSSDIMEELLGSQDSGHLCLNASLAAHHAQQVSRGLAGAQSFQLLFCVHSLLTRMTRQCMTENAGLQ